MKHIYSFFALVVFLLSLGGNARGQTTIFTESMGTVSSTTTIAAHEANNGFDNDGYTMTQGGAANPGDIRQTSVSSGYIGASGLANVWLTSTNAAYGFAIEGIDASTYNTLTVQFGYRKESASTLPTLALDYWDGTQYVNVPFTFNEAANASVAWYLSPIINLPSGAEISNLRLRWVKSGSVAVRIDDVVFKGIVSGVPSITVSPSSLSGLSYVQGSGPSMSQSYDLGGSNLNPASGDLTVDGSINYLVSTDDITFSSSVNVAYSEGTLPTTPIYVILKGGLSAGDYNSEIIANSGGGATTQNVTCSGSVTSPPPPDAPVATSGSSITYNSFTANWNAVSGATSYRLDVYEKTAGVTATDLFFSEYLEGSSNNKAIEIYNGTGSPVDLSNYTVELYSNGASSPGNTLTLSGILAHDDVYVIANSGANATILALANITSTVTFFNGDDALALLKISTNSHVDIFGRIGEDPGTQWGTAPLTTVEQTLVRKSTITGGVTINPGSGFPTLETEWDAFDQDVTTYLGSHTMAGVSTISYVSGYQDLNVGNVNSYPASGLSPSTTYYYVVRAVNDYGTSINSNEISVEVPLPVELSSFNAVSVKGNVTLNWQTTTEINSSLFEIERRAVSSNEWLRVGMVQAAGNSNSPQSYSFTDAKLQSGKYSYRLKMIDADGRYQFSNVVEAEVGLPQVYAISQNYPNPFNPSTRIDYQLPFDSRVTLELYGITGEKVATLINSDHSAGYYTSEVNASALNLASGIYVYRMVASGSNNQTFTQVKKLMLTK